MKSFLFRVCRNICSYGREKKRIAAGLSVLPVLFGAVFGMTGCAVGDNGFEQEKMTISDTSEESYGVFLGINEKNFKLSIFEGYDLVVVDAQELSSKQLAQLHDQGHVVYSYLNVGSIENNRDYYKEYKDVRLDKYENWPDENWVDVTQQKWQEFVGEVLPQQILENDPDIDGLFLDNLDVYSHVKEKKKYRSKAEDVRDALIAILKTYKEAGFPVLINGADEFVSELIDEGLEELVPAVNQETVFSSILDYDKDKFGEQSEKENEYYLEYLDSCDDAGIEVYLLEYTKDTALKETICTYCRKKGYRFYISEYVNLDSGVKEKKK